jgi:UDP-glucose 4-epimerase
MKVLILGGSGFLGSAVARALCSEDIEVRVLCRTQPPEALFGAASIDIHLADWASLTPDHRAFDGVYSVLHFISTTTPSASMEDMPFDVSSNLLPTLNLLKILESRRIRRLIYASSGGTVYGIPSTLPVTEKDSTNPICSHGITKLAIEKFIAVHARLTGLEFNILRIGNPYGIYQLRGVPIGSIARFVQMHAAGKEIEIWGDGSVVRDYLYIDDFCNAMTQIVRNPVFRSGEYNLASGSGHSLLEIVEELSRITNRKVAVSFAQERSIDVPKIVLDISRLRRALPLWRPTVSFSEGIERMWLAAQQGLRSGIRDHTASKTINENEEHTRSSGSLCVGQHGSQSDVSRYK